MAEYWAPTGDRGEREEGGRGEREEGGREGGEREGRGREGRGRDREEKRERRKEGGVSEARKVGGREKERMSGPFFEHSAYLHWLATLCRILATEEPHLVWCTLLVSSQ